MLGANSPTHPSWITTPVGVSATSHFSANASVHNITRSRVRWQELFSFYYINGDNIDPFTPTPLLKNHVAIGGISNPSKKCAPCTFFSYFHSEFLFGLAVVGLAFCLFPADKRLLVGINAATVILVIQIIGFTDLGADFQTPVFLEIAMEIFGRGILLL